MSDEIEEEPGEEISDEEFTSSFRMAALSIRSEVALRLLAGNDTACFSTEQYRAAYEARYPVPTVTSEQLWAYITPEAHLCSIPVYVHEVAPGVWAAAK